MGDTKRAEAIQRVLDGEPLLRVARETGIPRSTLRDAVDAARRAAAAAAERPSTPNDDDADLAAALVAEVRKREKAEREKRLVEAQLRELTSELEELRPVHELLYGAEDRQSSPPEWLVPPRSEAEHHGTVNLVLSDLHLDEVVRPAEVNGVNAFDRRIAELRLQRAFEKAVTLPRDFWAGVTYDGIVVHLAGDTFSGNIHEELARSNEATPLESVLYWIDPFVAGIRVLVEHYGRVHIVSVPGNHDRTTRKPIHKGRVVTSLHYLFTRFLEREFRGDDRVSWDIPQTPDALTTIYDTTILTTHGDRFRGGNGIGGILVPILRGAAKTSQRQVAIGQAFDYMVIGHFHQYIAGPGVLINGSMKGYDEYAWNNSFAFEPPQQALFLVTPEHGPSFHMPIVLGDKAREQWHRVK